MLLYINGNYPNHSLHSELVFKLAEMGNDITVFVPLRGKKQEGLYPCNHPRVSIVYSDCLNYFDSVFFIYKVHKIMKLIERQIDLSKVDCILAGTVYSDGAVAYLLNKKYSIPFSVAVRGTDTSFQMRYRPYLNGFVKQLIKRTTKVIFLAPSYKSYFQKFGIDQSKITMIPNAVNDFWFEQQKTDRTLHDPSSLIFVGELLRNKNVETTILTVAELKRRNIKVEFHIIGAGIEEKKCRSLAEKHNVDEQVFFHGWQDGKDKIKKYYDQSDIFVMLSFRETFGTVYVEALSQGIPIIFTKGQGIDGYFEEGVIGYSCDPTDINEIANKIIMIQDHYCEISEQCIRQSRRFMWEEVANQYYKVICDMRAQ